MGLCELNKFLIINQEATRLVSGVKVRQFIQLSSHHSLLPDDIFIMFFFWKKKKKDSTGV